MLRWVILSVVVVVLAAASSSGDTIRNSEELSMVSPELPIPRWSRVDIHQVPAWWNSWKKWSYQELRPSMVICSLNPPGNRAIDSLNPVISPLRTEQPPP